MIQYELKTKTGINSNKFDRHITTTHPPTKITEKSDNECYWIYANQ